MSDFRKLEVWRNAHDLMLQVHSHAGAIRGGAYLSLKSQIIRASMSIPANIVEAARSAPLIQRTIQVRKMLIGLQKTLSGSSPAKTPQVV